MPRNLSQLHSGGMSISKHALEHTEGLAQRPNLIFHRLDPIALRRIISSMPAMNA
ncbi:hypothetical protein M2I94_15275 [Pseudomonas aeruginosa]|uniref:hypothetical protein n=1 Tax=Pseudomonas aeruginosa TaxID=287 RepID=UPI0024BFF6A3|nr:hypothetical protein [Pseudomonas aeruginosa]WHV67127.1 hypothetical protein M2I94_15275 [Pseudomonas aeruginosa]